MSHQAGRANWLIRIEWSVSIAATLVAIVLHLIYLTHAGGLWRDEAGIVCLGTLPGLSQMWRMVYAYDTYPMLFPGMIHFWSWIGLGGSDFGLRCFGLLVGLGILATVWLATRTAGRSPPLIALGLLAVNLTLVRYGDSLRAYGLGSLLIVVTFALVWSLARKPGAGRFAAAALTAVLSVQCFYQGAFLLLAICIAAAVVCFRRKQDKAALSALTVGVPAALSLLPYLRNLLGGQSWAVVEQTGFNASVVFANLWKALGSPGGWPALLWFGLMAVAAVRGFATLAQKPRARPVGLEDAPLFAAMVIVFSLAGFLLFLVIAKLPTQPWYWLPLMPLAAVCVEIALADWPGRFRSCRLGLAGMLLCIPLPAGVKLAQVRQTNIDLIAARLAREAQADDYIVVYPWFCGVTFNRYYKGSAPWTTLPAISDNRWHRYDLIKDRLASTEPIRPVLDRIAQTLAAGKRVWVVGSFPAPEAGETQPRDLPPAPESDWGWSDLPYNYVWGRQADRCIAVHAGSIEVVLTAGSDVNPEESALLTVAALHPSTTSRKR